MKFRRVPGQVADKVSEGSGSDPGQMADEVPERSGADGDKVPKGSGADKGDEVPKGSGVDGWWSFGEFRGRQPKKNQDLLSCWG